MRTTLVYGLVLLCAGALYSAAVAAEQKQSFGEFDVHFNGVDSRSLTSEIARQYRITRAKNQGLLVIAVQQRDGDNAHAVSAMLSGKVRNELAQASDLSFKQVVEGSAIYYLATFKHDNREQMSFNIDVQPEGQPDRHQLRFNQVFFTE